MRCGAKCFTVELETEGKKKRIPVTARTSVEARKAISKEYGKEVIIVFVKEDKKNKQKDE